MRPVQRDLLTALVGAAAAARRARLRHRARHGRLGGRAHARRGRRPRPGGRLRPGRARLAGPGRPGDADPGRRWSAGSARWSPRAAPPVALLVPLAAVALALDAVDGRVARAHRHASRLGARFDMEVDAVPDPRAQRVRRRVGRPVGARDRARALRPLAGRAAAALAAPGVRRRGSGARSSRRCRASCWSWPPRTCCPVRSRRCCSSAALVLLAESFGRQVLWLWRHRASRPAEPAPAPERVAA